MSIVVSKVSNIFPPNHISFCICSFLPYWYRVWSHDLFSSWWTEDTVLAWTLHSVLELMVPEEIDIHLSKSLRNMFTVWFVALYSKYLQCRIVWKMMLSLLSGLKRDWYGINQSTIVTVQATKVTSLGVLRVELLWMESHVNHRLFLFTTPHRSTAIFAQARNSNSFLSVATFLPPKHLSLPRLPLPKNHELWYTILYSFLLFHYLWY